MCINYDHTGLTKIAVSFAWRKQMMTGGWPGRLVSGAKRRTFSFVGTLSAKKH
jgi:hypothetical protein